MNPVFHFRGLPVLSLLLLGPVPSVHAAGVPVGQSILIETPDYSDTFTLETGTRLDLPPNQYPVGAAVPEALAVEEAYGNPEVFWSDTLWSLSRDANILNGTPAYPGPSGAGSDTGLTQTGNAVDFGLEYGLREDFVVQFDAVQTTDRVNITIGDARDSIAGAALPSGLSIFFRADGHPELPEVGIYNAAIGEMVTDLDTGLAGVAVGQWHNYAVRFNLTDQELTIYVDQIKLGTLNLALLEGELVRGGGVVEAGAFAGLLTEASNEAVSVGAAGGNRVWTDNFQIGAPRVDLPATILASAVQVTRDHKETEDESDDTFDFTVRIEGTGPVSAEGWTAETPAGVTGPASGAYGVSLVYAGVPVALSPVTLTFTDADTATVTTTLAVTAPPAPLIVKNFSVPVGASTVIGELDYSDTFTLGTGTRTELPPNQFPVGAAVPEALVVEESYGNPEVYWSDSLWSLSRDADVINGTPNYPGASGGGSDTGITQTGNTVDFGLEYGLRRDFVVQFDAVQTGDRIDITIGGLRDAIATEANEGALSVFFRADAHQSLPRLGIYNAALGEISAGLELEALGIDVGEWHNYAVRFNLPEEKLVLYVDEQELGTVDLATLEGATVGGGTVFPGDFVLVLTENSHATVSIGGATGEAGNRVWTDNFQIGAPAGAVAAGDTDGDGASDAEEAIAGTNPRDATSVLRLTAFQRLPGEPGGTVSFRFPSVAGRFYRAYTSRDLRAWTRDEHAGAVTGTGTELSFTLPVATEDEALFYRVQVQTEDTFPETLP